MSWECFWSCWGLHHQLIGSRRLTAAKCLRIRSLRRSEQGLWLYSFWFTQGYPSFLITFLGARLPLALLDIVYLHPFDWWAVWTKPMLRSKSSSACTAEAVGSASAGVSLVGGSYSMDPCESLIRMSRIYMMMGLKKTSPFYFYVNSTWLPCYSRNGIYPSLNLFKTRTAQPKLAITRPGTQSGLLLQPTGRADNCKTRPR